MKKKIKVGAPRENKDAYLLPFKPVLPKVPIAPLGVADPVIHPHKLVGIEFEGKYISFSFYLKRLELC